MTKRRKIAVIASSRATYGYKRRLIGMIHKSPDLELQLIVTGMHLLKKYGYSVRDIESDGYPIAARVKVRIAGGTSFEWTKSIGAEIRDLSKVFNRIKPDIAVVTGDRAEMFAAAVTAAYMNIPIAHIQAGDVSGHIDGSARHAITKLSHIHLAACADSARRVARMGEELWRIHNVGAPQLDEIVRAKKLSQKRLKNIFNTDFKQPVILVIQHPVLVETDEAYRQMKETLEAIKSLKLPTIVFYPNVDAGGKNTITAIKEYEGLPFIHTIRNIKRDIFIGLLSEVSVIVGNSSCGILEAPSFKLPAVNMGDRQRGRLQGGNVINTDYNRNRIRNAIKKALYDGDFKARLRRCVNPYGDGRSSERIIKILKKVELGKRLLDKKITY